MFKLLNLLRRPGTKVKCVRNACLYNTNGQCFKKKIKFDYGKGIGFVCKDFDFE